MVRSNVVSPRPLWTVEGERREAAPRLASRSFVQDIDKIRDLYRRALDVPPGRPQPQDRALRATDVSVLNPSNLPFNRTIQIIPCRGIRPAERSPTDGPRISSTSNQRVMVGILLHAHCNTSENSYYHVHEKRPAFAVTVMKHAVEGARRNRKRKRTKGRRSFADTVVEAMRKREGRCSSSTEINVQHTSDFLKIPVHLPRPWFGLSLHEDCLPFQRRATL